LPSIDIYAVAILIREVADRDQYQPMWADQCLFVYMYGKYCTIGQIA